MLRREHSGSCGSMVKTSDCNEKVNILDTSILEDINYLDAAQKFPFFVDGKE
jgi:hypothetical protein